VGPIDGGHQSGTFPLPPLQAINLGASAPEFGFYLLAEAALVVVVLSHIDKLHSACFAGAVLVIAPVGEAGPAPVSTGETLLVVKTHCLSDALVPLAYEVRSNSLTPGPGDYVSGLQGGHTIGFDLLPKLT
jgi:hypothetical protein